MAKSVDSKINNTRYCVLWIPTTQHKPIVPLLEHDIDDLKKTLIEINEKVDHLPIFNRENGDIYLKNVSISDIKIEEKFSSDEKALIDEMPDYLTEILEPEDIKSLREPHSGENNQIPLYLDLTLKANTSNPCHRDIDIICNEKDANSFKQIWKLTLKCEDTSRNGLIKYSYTVDEESGRLLDSNDNLIHAVYHAIKGFYHIHEFHEEVKEVKDSILNPFKTEDPLKANIKKDNNPALIHYLELFGEMFDGFVKDYRSRSIESDILYTMDDVEGEAEEQKKKIYNRKDRAYKIYKNLLRLCTNALGISVYAKSLLMSKYNKSFSEQHLIASHQEGENGYTICQKAINLYNSIDYIRLIKIRTRNRLNITTTENIRKTIEENEKTSNKLWVLSIVLAVVGLVLAVVGVVQTVFSKAPSLNQIENIIIKNTEPLNSVNELTINNIPEIID
jgi:hypothetical protein